VSNDSHVTRTAAARSRWLRIIARTCYAPQSTPYSRSSLELARIQAPFLTWIASRPNRWAAILRTRVLARPRQLREDRD